MKEKKLQEKSSELLEVLRNRFELNKTRHPNLSWTEIENRILNFPEKLKSLSKMEETGGEPDVIGKTAMGEILFCDCSKESPTGRRSICYDQQALESRKENKPVNSAMGLAEEMGVEILDEDEYKKLQTLGEFDLKTSSWLKTPKEIRKLGGAVFGDRRYNHIFIYHNGVESYYSARGFRALLKI
jgi:hypothetical protein